MASGAKRFKDDFLDDAGTAMNQAKETLGGVREDLKDRAANAASSQPVTKVRENPGSSVTVIVLLIAFAVGAIIWKRRGR